MILIDGPDGVQFIPVRPESLRLGHVLTLAELFRVNAILEDHGVATFAETVTVGMVLDRVRWLEGRWRAHVIGELVAALSAVEEEGRG